MYLKALCVMRPLKWKGGNPNSWVRFCAALCATPPTPVAPFTCTYISFWYWHHFLMPKATRELQKRSRAATAVGQGKLLALVFLLSPVRDTQSSSECPQGAGKSRLAACDSLLPALHSSGVSAVPHHQAEDPKLWALWLWFTDLAHWCCDWVCELISATHWFTWRDYSGTAQRSFNPKPISFLCSPLSCSAGSSMSQCRRAHLPTPALLPNGLFFTPLTPDPAKTSAKGLSCLSSWALVGSTASQSHFSCLSPLQCWDSPHLPLSVQPPLGCWQRCPQVLGMEKKERRSTVLLQLPEGAAVAWVPEKSMAPVSPPVVLASPPCARLAMLVCHQPGSHPPWLGPLHHPAWAVAFPWGSSVWLAKFYCWKKTCTGTLLADGRRRLECQKPVTPCGMRAQQLWLLFSSLFPFFLKSPGQMAMVLQVLCFYSGMLKEEDL